MSPAITFICQGVLCITNRHSWEGRDPENSVPKKTKYDRWNLTATLRRQCMAMVRSHRVVQIGLLAHSCCQSLELFALDGFAHQ